MWQNNEKTGVRIQKTEEGHVDYLPFSYSSGQKENINAFIKWSIVSGFGFGVDICILFITGFCGR